MITKYDYLADLKERKYEKVAELVRQGDISELNKESLNLLADRIEGKNKGGRSPDPFLEDTAIMLANEYACLKQYGLPTKELMQLSIKTMERDGNNSIRYKDLGLKGMTRIEALEKIKAECLPENHKNIDLKRISDLITMGNKLNEIMHGL